MERVGAAGDSPGRAGVLRNGFGPSLPWRIVDSHYIGYMPAPSYSRGFRMPTAQVLSASKLASHWGLG